MVHGQLLTGPEDREPGEYDQGDDFLQGLEFGGAVDAIADAVRRDDEAIFEEGDPPCDQHRKPHRPRHRAKLRSEEHTSELQSLMRISYAVFCLNKNKIQKEQTSNMTTQCS